MKTHSPASSICVGGVPGLRWFCLVRTTIFSLEETGKAMASEPSCHFCHTCPVRLFFQSPCPPPAAGRLGQQFPPWFSLGEMVTDNSDHSSQLTASKPGRDPSRPGSILGGSHRHLLVTPPHACTGGQDLTKTLRHRRTGPRRMVHLFPGSKGRRLWKAEGGILGARVCAHHAWYSSFTRSSREPDRSTGWHLVRAEDSSIPAQDRSQWPVAAMLATVKTRTHTALH